MAKRNITVREKELIDKLNNKVIGVDLAAEGQDTTVVTKYDSNGNIVEHRTVTDSQCQDFRWDNSGPIYFEEEKETDHKTEEDTRVRTPEQAAVKEQVNHPAHYNDYDVEVIEMMERIFGHEAVINFCRLNAFKYRMRAGHKDGNSLTQDLNKERWYLDYIKNHS